MKSVVLWNFCSKKHNITYDPKKNLLQLPELTGQLNQILTEKGKKIYTKKKKESSCALDKKSTTIASVASTFRMYFVEVFWPISILYRTC